MYPDVYHRFKDFCELKALERRITSEQSISDPLCWDRENEEAAHMNKFELVKSQVQMHLLHLTEFILLKPAGGNHGSDIMHRFLLSPSTDMIGAYCWQSISCVLREKGEFFYINERL